MIKSISLCVAGGIVGAAMASVVLAAPPTKSHPMTMTIMAATHTEDEIYAHVAALDQEIEELRGQLATLQTENQNNIQSESPNEQNIPRGN
jgi:5,10-methylenetetrahydrofolate reductase